MSGQEPLPAAAGADLIAVAADLHGKRAVLSEEINKARANLDRIEGEMRAVDTVLRLFGVGPALHYYSIPLHSRDLSKILRVKLRMSIAPLTSIELTRAIMAERQMNPDDRELFKQVRFRIGASLRNLRAHGTLTSAMNTDGLLEWKYVEGAGEKRPKIRPPCKP